MSVLSGKNILLGVTGGIAAYKTTYLVRLLIKSGARVKVVMTPAAKEFVTPLTLSTLSKNEVYSSFTSDDDENAVWNNHVDLGLWADLFIIAPETANTLSKMVSGNSDNFLIATYLSAKCPVYVAPAMDLDMFKHQSTQDSFDKLKSFGNSIIPSGVGELASGLFGEGRMAEPQDIIAFIENDILDKLPLRGKTVLITAGPTYEAIDPVRFIGNRSSGKMGYEIAKTAANKGANVILISGPTHLNLNHSSVKLIRVNSADEMYDMVHKHFTATDIAICSAAVADYKPKHTSAIKIKKKTDSMTIELEKNRDILASLGSIKNKQFLVGFALETNDELKNAKNKLIRKNLDFIVLNSLNDKGAGFGGDTNKISIIHKNNEICTFELKSKTDVANDIINEILKSYV